MGSDTNPVGWQKKKWPKNVTKNLPTQSLAEDSTDRLLWGEAWTNVWSCLNSPCSFKDWSLIFYKKIKLSLPYLALTPCSPIAGVASISILYWMETLYHTNLSCLAPFFNLMPRAGKPHLNNAICAFGNGENQTLAACTASKCAIHYTIAYQEN